ncbi:MAG: lipocalin family protein [Roseobacter sp.]|jgi:apolipoprotein D and lipocalin family protein|nr:lipocalin family protein [Roseobacter sp.]
MPLKCALFVLLLLTACGTVYRDKQTPLVPQADFDAARYLGTWYEIARYPVPFQAGCTATTATYGAIDADTISVINQCRQGSPEGALNQIKGKADVTGPGQLTVRFAKVPFLRGPYWVLWVDEDYETAVVGVPSGRAGWILARQPQITQDRRNRAEEVLRRNGYDPADLFNVPHANQ